MEAEVQAQEGRAVIHLLFLSRCLVGKGITVMEAELLLGLLSAIWRLRKACAVPSSRVARSRSAAED